MKIARFALSKEIRQWLQRTVRQLDVPSTAVRALNAAIRQGLVTANQAEVLWRVCRISLVDLLADAAPTTPGLPLVDYRRSRTTPDTEMGLRELVAAALVKQEWLSELRRERGEAGWSLPERHAKDDIVAWTRKRLGWDEHSPPRVGRHDLEQRCEELGVLLISAGRVPGASRPLPPEEIRGFSAFDRWAPLIFVNARDTDEARVFTICHELAHLAMGRSAISEPDFTAETASEERLCNEVAAELLMPERPMRDAIREIRRENLEEAVRSLASSFRVSPLAMAVRVARLATDLKPEVERVIASMRRRSSRGRADAPRGWADPYRAAIRASGRILIREVLAQLQAGEMTYRQAKDVLGVSYKVLLGLEERLGRLKPPRGSTHA